MPYPTLYSILPEPQQEIWKDLAPLRDMGFVLYGGTALALRYGHRESIDFDFFSEKPLDKNAIRGMLPALARGQTLQDEPNTLVALALAGNDQSPVKLSFFGGLDWGRVGKPELTQDGVILTASVRDLMATKLKVLFDRIEIKDYLDIAEMLKRGTDLGQGLSDAKLIFPSFSPLESLRALSWYNEPGLEKLPGWVTKILTDMAARAWGKELPPTRLLASSLGLSASELDNELALL